MIPADLLPSIDNLHRHYADGLFSPRELVAYMHQKADQYAEKNIWIRRFSLEELEPFLAHLEEKAVDVSIAELISSMPLYGIPFVLKDNIDLAGFTTTAGCREFAYEPEKSAFVVQQLMDAGAIPMGKANLDQFATGLVGTRSPEPWGPCQNSIHPEYISGGSSSGSAVSVALGLATFSLGTDTAGSGRVPAMLNNIIGLKPSRGLLSMSGVVPACRSLDCPSVFALSIRDAERVFSVAAQCDEQDAYARANPYSNSYRYRSQTAMPPVIAVPQLDPACGQLNFFGEQSAEALYFDSLEIWKSLGADIVEVDMSPLLAAAKLLYEGPWVAERYAAIEQLMQSSPEAVHPVVRGIVQTAESRSAVEAFKAEYQMQAYRAEAERILSDVDFLLTPTAPRAYLIEELLNDPVQLNSNMGYYTNYMNLMDLCGVAVPAGFMSNGMPFGITLVGKKFTEQKLLNYARLWEQRVDLRVGATNLKNSQVEVPQAQGACFQESIPLAVCGAHLSDMPLNWQLVERGATLMESTKTAERYRFYALNSAPPVRPGLVRQPHAAGVSVDVEVWSIPAAELGSFVAEIPYPLGIGKVELTDGSWVNGFICEASAVEDAEDISALGSWRKFMARH